MSWRADVAETAGGAEPRWSGGMPRCHDGCAQHDGKRCRLLGLRAPEDKACEPVVIEMSELLDRGRP